MLLDHPFDGPTAIRTHIAAIFISLELSRSNWLVTSLSPRLDGETLLRALLAYKRGEPRVCAMVVAPSPEEEDRRRLCRERRTLIEERITHVNRIKGLLFAQGISDYAPLRRDRRGRLEALPTGDGRELPSHLKAKLGRA